jgi:hypothetical protein
VRRARTERYCQNGKSEPLIKAVRRAVCACVQAGYDSVVERLARLQLRRQLGQLAL